MKKLVIGILLFMTLALAFTGCEDIPDNLSQKDQERLQEEMEKRGYDTSDLFPSESNTTSTNNAPVEQTKLGDVIELGDINWIVLSVESDKMLVLSEEVLEMRKWQDIEIGVKWEYSDIRAYLNNSFYNATFNNQEKTRILDSELENKSNPSNVFSLSGGSNTIDKVFLLSLDEVYQYMGDNAPIKARTARVAKYIVTGEAEAWDLRSHGKGYYKAGCNHYEGSPCHPEVKYYSMALVYSNGKIGNDTTGSITSPGGIRPAMWITLK